MRGGSRLKSGDSRLKGSFWYGRKAMAVYAVIAIVVAFLGNDYLRSVINSTVTQPMGESKVQKKENPLVGQSIKDLRATNDVRPLRFEEQSMNIERLVGIYGFTRASFFERNLRVNRNELLYAITLQNEPDRYRGVIEIHKTDEGKVMIVGYVDQGSIAIVTDKSQLARSLYLYHKPVREGQVPVAIPASRINDWDYRAPHEFSEIKMN